VKTRKPVQNLKNQKHASRLKQGIKVLLQKEGFCAEYKVLFGANPIQQISEYHTPYFQA
jgi:hypothetical protein